MRRQRRLRPGRLATLLTGLACAALLAWIQLSFDGLYDGDSYFHARAAQQLGEHGIQSEFPQAAFSTWKERYSDKDLLFHALSIPFLAGEGDLVARGKWAVVFFDALFVAALTATVMILDLRFGPVWILLAVAHPFLLEQLIALRPQVLAMALFPLEIVLLLTYRRLGLGLASASHVLAHSSFVVVPGLPLAHGIARRWHGLSFPWRSLAAVLGGIALASLLHPYFPRNLSLAYDQLVEVPRNVWAGRPDIPRDLFGTELHPMRPSVLVGEFPVWLPAVAGLAAAIRSRSRPRLSTRSLTLAWVWAGFLMLTCVASRFFPFFAVMSALVAGSVWSELAAGWSWRALVRRGSAASRAGALLVAGCALLALVRTDFAGAPARVESYQSPEVYRPAIAFLAEVAAPEDQVYHSFWWPFAWLYHFRPEGRYVVGLDPVFLYRYDAELFRRMLDAHRGRGDVYEIIAGDFGARWVFVEKLPRTRALRRRLRDESRLERRYQDDYAVIYEVVDRPLAGR